MSTIEPATDATYTFRPARSVRRGDLLFTGGIVDVGADGRIQHPGDAKAQARAIFRAIEQILGHEGGSLDDVVCIGSFHADVRDIVDVLGVGHEFFRDDYPAWTPAGFVGTFVPGAQVMIRVVAHLGDAPKKTFVSGSQPWLRDYPVSSGVRKGDLLFISGQSGAGVDGRVETPADHIAHARQAYAGMREVLEWAGAGIDDVIDFTSFHQDIRGAIPTLEQVYRPEIMGGTTVDHAPTTSHVGSTGLFPFGALGAYTAIADLSSGRRLGSTPEVITWNQGDGAYPIAGASKKAGGVLVTVSGQVSSGPGHTIAHRGDIEAQLRFIFEQIRMSIEGFGGAMADVVEVNAFCLDPRYWDAAQKVAAEFFAPGEEPAWTFVASPGLWLEGYLAEIAAIAVVEATRG